MISRYVIKKQRGRKPLTAFAVAGLVIALLAVAGTVLAVHEDFQLDGDIASSTTTSIGGTTQSVDWDSLFNADGTTKSSLPSGFGPADLTRDFVSNTAGAFVTSDTTTFATGSKDTLPISGWQCNYDNNVNSKIDVMNAYATAFTAGNGDQIIYFALERNTNTGDANVAFWFLQDAVGCETAGAAKTFTGAHMDGDLLIVSAFTKGGNVSTIDVYRWDRPGNPVGVPGSLRTTPVAHGVDCRDPNTASGDAACAAANTSDLSSIPWLTANFKDGVGHSLRTGEFFEGGVNLTKSNLGGKCFNTFIGDTRSSQSLTATLFDYAEGVIGECTSTTQTTPKYDDGTSYVDVPAAGISIGTNARVNVRDSALLTVTGVPSYGGTVTFSLCGPLSLTSTSNCQTGGVQIGDPVAVSGASPETVLGPIATLTSAGRYCWRADYSGDSTAGVPASSDPSNSTSVTECFKVNPVQPVLTTQATIGPVDFGSVISDKVFLTGTAKQPGTDGVGPGNTINATAATQAAAGGTIRVTAYGPDNCTTVALSEVTTTAAGDKASPNAWYFGPGSATEFTPSAPGQYTFVASYDGNDPNTLGVAATACGSQPSNEKVTVRTIPTQITTAPSYFPQDSATITSSVTGDNLPANGTVTFKLYGAASGNSALQNCQAGGATGLVYSPAGISTGAAAHSVTVGTNNTTFRVTATGTYYWLVTYAPGDTAHTGIQSACVENINATITGDAGPGTTYP